jgi:segregation and condensation protein A
MNNNLVPTKVNSARLYGEPITNIPKDLFIPPDALELILDAFEGPLDLLIYLIRRENFNILDIPMVQVTSQYLVYVEKIRAHNLELASEYLLMAAVLIEIKARMLIPKQKIVTDEEELDDPRAELVRQLIEFEKYKKAAKIIDEIPRIDRELYAPYVLHISTNKKILPVISSDDLHKVFKALLISNKLKVSHSITKELLSVKDHMSLILKKIKDSSYFEFKNLFRSKKAKSRISMVVHFLALLELAKSGLVKISQAKYDATIWVSDSNKNVTSKFD